MIYTDMTMKAMRICYRAHAGQFDKGGVPYVFHPFHVAEQMEDELTTTVALLHDVVEDSWMTVGDLEKEGFPEEVREAVAVLTRDLSIPYMDYIEIVRKHPVARIVKMADLQHNSDVSRLPVKDAYIEKLLGRYKEAIRRLSE